MRLRVAKCSVPLSNSVSVVSRFVQSFIIPLIFFNYINNNRPISLSFSDYSPTTSSLEEKPGLPWVL